ncbi:MAG TPA: TraR/DksA C4-type zinc finger protein [Candidatus Paceibacterota bacterium]|nr:TraR/DksA C4-type zinc finger protein [Candidatus Paceibacterota bacterium]
MDTKNYKIKLEEERALLQDELGALGKVNEDGDWETTADDEMSSQEVQDEADMAEKATDYEERSIKLNSLESRLADVNKALLKIEEGDYGICEKCGKQIEEDRLEVNPAAVTCKECMNKVM